MGIIVQQHFTAVAEQCSVAVGPHVSDSGEVVRVVEFLLDYGLDPGVESSVYLKPSRIYHVLSGSLIHPILRDDVVRKLFDDVVGEIGGHAVTG